MGNTHKLYQCKKKERFHTRDKTNSMTNAETKYI